MVLINHSIHISLLAASCVSPLNRSFILALWHPPPVPFFFKPGLLGPSWPFPAFHHQPIMSLLFSSSLLLPLKKSTMDQTNSNHLEGRTTVHCMIHIYAGAEMSEVKQLVWPWTRCGLRPLQGQRLGDRHFVGKEIHQESASLASTLNVDGILMV